MRFSNLGKSFLVGIFFFSCLFALGVPQPVHAQGKTIMVIAPHPDDEALCCSGVIYANLQAGNNVVVVIVTNGDDYTSPASKSAGLTREAESIAAMQNLGLSSSNVIFFGYGDQALQQLLYTTSSTTVYTSLAGQTKTYANSGLGGVSYHQYLTGSAGSYTQANILSDFQSVLKNFAPTDIYTTGFWDDHPDHRSVYGFTSEALIALKKQGLLPTTRIHETWIHAPCEYCESYTWPEPVFTPTQPFPEPDYISQTPYDWTQIENIPVPTPMQDPNQSTNLKWNTIYQYHSQTGDDPTNYLFGFVKAGEFFWVRNFETNVAVLATATASSQATSNLDTAANAIDGIIGGLPDPLENTLDFASYSVSGGGEWVTKGQTAGAWIKLTWPASVTTSEVILYGRPDGTDNVLSGTLTFSDGSSVPVGALPVGGAGMPISFASKTITWMQFTVNTAQGSNIGLSEIEVFGTLTSSTTAFGPQMTDGPVASDSTLNANQPATLTASAFDVFGYPLTYSWTANGGTFTGSGASVTYNPPGTTGTYAATTTVTDGHGGSTQNSTFIIVSCALCGTITGPGGSGATITLSGKASGTTTTSAAGVFSFNSLSNGTYTVTPSLAGYTFNPTSQSVTVSGGNATANFSSGSLTYSVTGTINGAAGAMVTLTSGSTPIATTTSGASGATYTLSGVPNGTYTVTPSLNGYTFSPSSAPVTVNAGNASVAAFTATANTLSSVSMNPIGVTGGTSSTGTVTLNGSAPAGGAVVTLSSNNTSATVPASVTVAAGATTATFTVTTTSVLASVAVTISATYGTTQTATLTVNPPPPFNPIRVNAGGPAYTDPSGNVWSADTGFTGGSTSSTTKTITNTTTPTLYQTERYGAMSYNFSVPAGSTYAVTLKFAEIYWTASGQRIFSVSINGTTVLSNFDIVAQAGAALKAIDETFNVSATTGTITIQFITGSQDLPKISAIQIAPSTVGITMTPTTASLSAGQQQTFTPTVTGSSNTAVTWTMNPQVGTLVGGVYTAPATITSPQTVTVTATSAADTTKSASSVVTLNPPTGVGISMTPGAITLTASQTQTFTATVTGTTNTAVTWTMNPQVGTLVNGLYTAPATITSTQTVIVTATSAANTTIFANSTVTLNPPSTVGITMTPTTASLSAGQQQTFTPTVTGTTNTSVTWTMSPQVGTLVGGLYTAPASITSTQAVTVTATSVADTTKSASSIVTLNPPSGTFAPIRVNGGGPAYTDPSGNVWSADTGFTGGTAASTTSTITNTTTPTLYQTERYGAMSYNFTVPAGASYAVTLKFAEIYYTTAGSRIFNVAINGTTVLSNFDIVAQAGGGLIALDKTFTVTPAASTITIQFITGTADLPKISAIQIVSSSGVGITMTPTTASLTGGQQQTFTPTVTGTLNTSVTWTMNPQVGTLVGGLYTAPASITSTQKVTVTATSVADSTQSASSTVTLNPPAGSFTPIRVNGGGPAYTDPSGNVWSADTGFTGGTAASTTSTITNTTTPTLYQTERYGAMSYNFTVPAGASYAVTLKFAEIYYTTAGSRIFNVAINGTTVLSNFDIVAQAGGGLIALDKTFTVTPAASTITIQFITGTADLPKISAIQIASYSGVGVTMTPTTASLSAGQQQTFTPTVTGSSNTAVTWTVNPQVGTLVGGLYTAPASITATQTVAVTATSVADPTQSASSTVTLNPPAGSFTPIRVNAGGPAYTDPSGNVWSADTGFSGGSTASTTKTITNTTTPTLYQTERYGVMTYTFTVPNGSHTVTLKFAEIYYTTAGSRIFSVAINGTTVLSNFDIVATAGGGNVAYDQAFPVTVTNGTVSIQFIQGSQDLPKISAIQIQ